MNKPEDSIPDHHEGVAVDVEDSVELHSNEEAVSFYQDTVNRLLNVAGWHDYAGVASADFALTDSKGEGVSRKPQEGDYFRICIPGPGIRSGDGYDWVRVEEITEHSEGDEEFTCIRVRPASSPVTADSDVAHFYTEEATSNFVVRRKGRTVSAEIHGRNEKPNVASANNLLDKVRNAVVGTGAVAAFSKLQWKALAQGLLLKGQKN